MRAAIAETDSSHPPTSRMPGSGRALGQTIGPASAVPILEPANPTAASSMVPIVSSTAGDETSCAKGPCPRRSARTKAADPAGYGARPTLP